MNVNTLATVAAEDAPLGVQLWPTRTPEYAPNFTLNRVEVVRTPGGQYVRWVYESGDQRIFKMGELVAVDGEALGEWMAADCPLYHRCGAQVQLQPADGWVEDDKGIYDYFCPRCSVYTNNASEF